MVGDEGRLVGGRYRLVALIGQGGMGRVWRGVDETLNRQVAVKEVLLPDGLPPGDRTQLVRRTLREAEVAAKLGHPGIITVHDVVRDADVPWIVMQYVSGPPPGRARRAGGPAAVAARRRDRGADGRRARARPCRGRGAP
ncbi:protein kinase domain-containing protein [Streptomyces antibioticus]|uniref:protein kinase domain-containing protein n=1 Tax=Streptomyces antibioticus TaxID=1890 RepID=UPI0033A8FC0A